MFISCRSLTVNVLFLLLNSSLKEIFISLTLSDETKLLKERAEMERKEKAESRKIWK